MLFDQFISETLDVLGTDAEEILVESPYRHQWRITRLEPIDFYVRVTRHKPSLVVD
jgi:hypothetical protein